MALCDSGWIQAIRQDLAWASFFIPELSGLSVHSAMELFSYEPGKKANALRKCSVVRLANLEIPAAYPILGMVVMSVCRVMYVLNLSLRFNNSIYTNSRNTPLRTTSDDASIPFFAPFASNSFTTGKGYSIM